MSLSAMGDYAGVCSQRFGQAWNRFWYTPADPLPLCVIRVLIAAVVVYWHATYAFDLVRWFGPHGMLPVEAIDLLRGAENTSFSLLDYVHSETMLWTVHLACAVPLLMFLVGFKTRLSAVFTLLVVLSYIHRAPLLTGQVEPIITLVLFYLCWAPCGAKLSVDAWRRRQAAEDETELPSRSYAARIVLRLIQVHIVLVYLMMAVGQLGAGGDTWWIGEAVWWLAVRPETRLVDLTGVLSGHIYLINLWTHAIVLFEIGFAVLIWVPLARPLLLALAVVMWAGLALLTGLTLFCLVMLIASLAFASPALLRGCLPAGRH